MSKVARTGNRRLDQLEHDIEYGIRSIGKSLMEIRDSRIYMEDYESFEAYCKERWGFTDRHARNLIDAEKVRAKIATVVPVESLRESHLIELSKLPEKQQAQVAAAVIEKCESEQREPTAKDFRQAVASESPTQSGTIVPVKTQETQGKQQKPAHEQDVWEDVEDEPEVKPEAATKDDLFFDEKDHAAAILALTKLGDEWLRKIKTLTLDKGGEYLSFEVQEIEDLIKRVKFKMRQSTFAHVCVDCKGVGKKCGKCKQIGWLCKGSLEFLDQRQKDLLGV